MGEEMRTLTYRDADHHMTRVLPELATAHMRWLIDYDDDPLQYLIFCDVFACFIEILLAMSATPLRDELLRRGFSFLDVMLRSNDSHVGDLGYIAILEGRDAWWLARAIPFLGPVGIAILDTARPTWRTAAHHQAMPDAEREIIDLYGVRDAIAVALQSEQISLAEIPGITSPRHWARYPSPDAARRDTSGVAFVSCFGVSVPYVICPASWVACDEATLLNLARDLSTIEGREPYQHEKARSGCYPIALGERVWNMRTEANQHSRYRGERWIHEQFVTRGMVMSIDQVLNGQRRRLISEDL